MEKSTFHLLVDGIRVTDGHLPDNEGSFLDLQNPVYLGGDPTSKSTKVGITPQSSFGCLFNSYDTYSLLSSLFFPVLPQGHNVPMNSVIGCIREFKMNEVVIGDAEASHKTLPCFDGLTEMGTYFGGGHIILGLTHFIDPDVLFYFPVVSVCCITH